MTEKKIAYLMPVEITGTRGNQKLYKLDPPMTVTDWDDENTIEVHEYVVVSATYAFGPETYIFPADENGEVTSYSELDGSYQGGLNHEQALNNAGYEVTIWKEQIEA